MATEFPFVTSDGTVTLPSLPTFKEYDWDFETDNFISDARGKHNLVEENAALKVWILKAMSTERFSYLAYTPRYGIELKPFIGKVMGVGERKSELKRMIVECLMVNPYIKSIDKIEFSESEHNRALAVNIELTTVYGKMTV